MRLIRRDDVRNQLSEKWIQDALVRTNELHKAYEDTAPQRAQDPRVWREAWSRLVNGAAPFWQDQELKNVFNEVSHGKCWYCEADVTQRADVTIDHFRPKNGVHEDKSHCGYWWLACDWKNYRYACTYCNSRRRANTGAGATTGGKQDQFPLEDETRRARPPRLSIDEEFPLLLDPMNPADVALLTFDRTGNPVPAAAKDQDPIGYQRAATSIEVFHLHRGEFNKRRKEIMTKMERHLEEAERRARSLGGRDTQAAEKRRAFDEALRNLVDFIRSEAEFSAAARAYLSSMRGSSNVARMVLDVR
ncbi:MAG: hypothetical protein JO171_11310 [Paludibacterium sp.]|uniref:hypothetical protein n=1 Tax=Paludibacterium sp. TaxID=1917523 RepID=UPI0025FEC025|nr:hypothetical protein [Paludibacterium sp.]MBV8047735.1 hypothetical protein [Paludibacterium sp.]